MKVSDEVLREKITYLLEDLLPYFDTSYKITFIARCTKEQGTDLVVTDDELPELIKSLWWAHKAEGNPE